MTLTLNWQTLTSVEQLENIKKESFEKPVLIFKHSTSCSISHMMLDRFQTEYNIDETSLNIYYLDLIANRAVSNKIAETFSVIHQSPQILVIKDGVSVFDTSHMMIAVDKVKEVL